MRDRKRDPVFVGVSRSVLLKWFTSCRACEQDALRRRYSRSLYAWNFRHGDGPKNPQH
jgi:hypothetical protein